MNDAPTMIPVPKLRVPGFPQFLFEWQHNFAQSDGKVWVIGLPGKFIDGEFVPAIDHQTARGFVLAEHCPTHGMFVSLVQTYLRGYRQGLQDQQMIAAGEAQRVLGYSGGGPKVETIPNVKGQYDG